MSKRNGNPIYRYLVSAQKEGVDLTFDTFEGSGSKNEATDVARRYRRACYNVKFAKQRFVRGKEWIDVEVYQLY